MVGKGKSVTMWSDLFHLGVTQSVVNLSRALAEVVLSERCCFHILLHTRLSQTPAVTRIEGETQLHVSSLEALKKVENTLETLEK